MIYNNNNAVMAYNHNYCIKHISTCALTCVNTCTKCIYKEIHVVLINRLATINPLLHTSLKCKILENIMKNRAFAPEE